MRNSLHANTIAVSLLLTIAIAANIRAQLPSTFSSMNTISAMPNAALAFDGDRVGSDDSQGECRSDGWFLLSELVVWKLHQRGLDYAVTEDGTALVLGQAQTQHLTMDRNAGIRAALGYRTSVGWDFSVGYTNFQTDGQASAVRPTGVGQLFGTRSHPDGNEEGNTAAAAGDFDYNVFDISASRSIVNHDYANVRLLGGLRWAQLDQNLRVDYDGRDFVEAVITESLDIRALGVRFGASGDWRMARGFGVYGMGTVSVLHGNFENQRMETNLSGADLIVDVGDDYQQALINLDANVGVMWQNGRWDIRAGYELSNWFNASDRLLFVDDQHEANFAPISNDILLEGFAFSVGYAW